MSKVLLFLFCCAAGEAAFAQADTAQVPERLLTINPIALVDPFGPSSLRVGYQRLVSPKISLALEACGYYQYLGTFGGTERLQGGGGRFSIIYWKKRSAPEALGISLDLGYKNTAGTVGDSIKLDSMAHYYRVYGIDRKVVTVRLCIVRQRHWTKRFWTEFYYGLGVRFEHSTSSGITEEELDARSYAPDNDDYITPAVHGVGDFIQPDLVIGLRIGWAWR